jgi:transposase-like protein
MAKMARWRRHTVEFKRQAVERMKTCENIDKLARELKIQRKLLYTWKYQFEGRPEPRYANLGQTAEDRKEKHLRDEITKLKVSLAERALEVDFFKGALRRIKEGRPNNTGSGVAASMQKFNARRKRSKAN